MFSFSVVYGGGQCLGQCRRGVESTYKLVEANMFTAALDVGSVDTLLDIGFKPLSQRNQLLCL